MNSLKEFLRAMEFMRSRIWSFGTGILGMSVFYASISVVESFMVKNIIDATVARDASLMTRGLILIVCAAAAIVVFVPIFQYMYNARAKEGLAEVQKTVFAHRGRLPIRYFELHHSGNMVSKLLNDAEVMSDLYTSKLRRLTFPFIYGLAAAVPMFMLDWKISLVLVFINLLSVYVNVSFSKRIRLMGSLIQEAAGRMTEQLMNLLAGIQIVKMFQIGSLIQRNYEDHNQEYAVRVRKRAGLGAALSGANAFLGMGNNIGLLLVGAWMVSRHSSTFGTLFALMSLQRRLNQAFLQVGEYVPQVQDSLAGAVRIFQFLDEPAEPERYDRPVAGPSLGYLELRDIVFSYDTKEPVLNRLSLSAGEGQTVALVGASGCGKSTVMKLILGFYPPDSGTLAVAGQPIGARTWEQVRSMIAYVPQDAYVFNGTIEENIRFGKPDATREELEEAARAAYAHSFIQEQPQGYDTVVGERGSRLSGGQRQRIAIARAFLKNAPILLLDEATSALDSESEQQIQEALDRLMRNRTTIVIAHRLSTIEKADNIYVMEAGQVVQQGTHSELLAMDGPYRTLYESQFKQPASSLL